MGGQAVGFKEAKMEHVFIQVWYHLWKIILQAGLDNISHFFLPETTWSRKREGKVPES